MIESGSTDEPPLHPSTPAPRERHIALNALLLIFIFNFTFQPLTEPDFGWHLRTGLDLLRHGWSLPASDPYSHTMPDWPWVEHAWLTDAVIGAVHGSWMGGLGVILLFGAVAAGAWLIASSLAPVHRPYRRLACALSLWVALPYLGARTQLISLLGFAVLLYVLSRRERKSWWWIPPLFLLWANLHGGFTMGLFFLILLILATWIVQRICACWATMASRLDEALLSRSDLKRLVLLTGTSAAMTLVNPYGWRLHGEILDSLANQFMLEGLQEWQPLSLATGGGRSYAVYLAMLAASMCFCYRRIEPVRWLLWGVFLWLSLRHMRNIPIFLIISLPLCAELLAAAFDQLSSLVPSGHAAARRWMAAATLGAALLLLWLGPEHLHHVVQSGTEPARYFKGTSYPIEAVEWIESHRDQAGTRLYNDYAYGGFLLWWLPAEKIFIDGRMPAWRIGERRIFEDYVALTATDPPALSVLDKYSVDWALVRRDSPLDRALERESRWALIYGDEKVSIYVRSPGS